MMKNEDISIIIPYHNEQSCVVQTIEMVSRQTLLPTEVILVNSSSTDSSFDIVEKWIDENQGKNGIQFRNLFERTDTPSSSKNVGIQRSNCAWVAFMDCGLSIPENWLELQLDYALEHQLDVVFGTCCLKGQGVIDIAAVSQTYGYQKCRACIPASFVKKSVFEQTGLFLENRRAGYDFAWRLLVKKMGIACDVNGKIILRYIGVNFASSIWIIFRKCLTYARPTIGIKHYYVPYFYIVALILFLCASYFFSWFFMPFVGLYFVLRGFVVPAIKSDGLVVVKKYPILSLLLPLVGFVSDVGRMFGILIGVVDYYILRNA